MSPLVISHNLSVPDPKSHFSSLWTTHWDSVATPWLTDLRLVASQQQEDMLRVHRAVLLPLCPFLALLVEEANREDEPLLLFPDFPPELVQSFVKLVYQGSCPLTEVTDVEALLKLLEAVGFDKSRLYNTNSDGLQLKVTVEKVDAMEDEVTQTRNVYNPSQKLDDYLVTAQEDCNVSEMFDYNFNKEVLVPAKFTVVKDVAVPNEDIEDMLSDVKDLGLLVKKPRLKSTDEKHFCQFCDFKCPFFIQLVNHSNMSHAGLFFSCDQCSYQGTKLMGLKIHKKQVHRGDNLGDFEKLQHNTGLVKSQEIENRLKSTQPEISSTQKLVSAGKRKGKPFNSEGKFSCPRCPFRTMFKTSLNRHVKKSHLDDIIGKKI